MKTYKSLQSRKILWSALLLFSLFASGCGVISEKAGNLAKYAADQKTLAEGNRAFKKGDFKKAMESFQSVSRDAEDERISCQALYGLACTRFALAESPAEMKEAMMLWNVWEQLVSKHADSGDPRMLTPLLQRVTAPPKDKPAEVSSGEKQDYRKLLQNKDKEIEKLHTTLAVMEKEVKTLKQQIESLEAIHQTIQEKKKELSSP